MTAESVRVLYLPSGVQIEARAGDTLLDAALDNGLNIQHECGGNCACTTCQVKVDSGGDNLSRIEEVEQDRLSTAEGRSAYSRLACQAILMGGEITVTVVEDLE
jgi:2Fe-2S ferredoxin